MSTLLSLNSSFEPSGRAAITEHITRYVAGINVGPACGAGAVAVLLGAEAAQECITKCVVIIERIGFGANPERRVSVGTHIVEERSDQLLRGC